MTVTDGKRNRPAGTRARLQRLAWLMDKSIRLPGGFRIGADGIIGLIPVVGDIVATGVSSYIVAEAARLQVPKSVLVRMVLNVFADFAVGSIPVLGDLFDFAFKANVRNINLLEAHLDAPDPTRKQSRWVIAAAFLVLASVAAATVTIVIMLAQFLWRITTA